MQPSEYGHILADIKVITGGVDATSRSYEDLETALSRTTLQPGEFRQFSTPFDVQPAGHDSFTISIRAIAHVGKNVTVPRSVFSAVYNVLGYAPTPNMLWRDLFASPDRQEILRDATGGRIVALALQDRYEADYGQTALWRVPRVIGVGNPDIREWEYRNSMYVSERSVLPNIKASSSTVF